MTNETNNTWGEYSKLVLKELETLAKNIENLKDDITELKGDFVKIDNKLSKVDDLYNWKKRVDEIVSPTQLSHVVQDVHDLKNFKVRALTIVIVMQFVLAVIVAISKFIQ